MEQNRFIRFMAPALLAGAFILPSCLGSGDAGSTASSAADDGGASSGGTASAQFGGNSGWTGGNVPPHGGTGAEAAIPDVTYVEDHLLRAERTLEFATVPGGELRRFREQVTSDGTGHVRLDLLAEWDDASGAWLPPAPEYATAYRMSGRWNVLLRDLHLGERKALEDNYDWQVVGRENLAGRSCLVTRADNVHGQGDVLLYHEDAPGGLLLGYAYFDENGDLQASLKTTRLDESPDLNGVEWPLPGASHKDWIPGVHDAVVGVTTRDHGQLPPGFYLVEQHLATPLPPSPLSPRRWDRWSDGLRTGIVLQWEGPGDPNSAQAPTEFMALQIEDWEYRMDTRRDALEFSVTGSLTPPQTSTVLAGYSTF